MIKLFTAGIWENNENIAKQKTNFQMTKIQLKKWKVNYHKLIFGKPSFDLFIDDKSINFKKNWHIKLDKYL